MTRFQRCVSIGLIGLAVVAAGTTVWAQPGGGGGGGGRGGRGGGFGGFGMGGGMDSPYALLANESVAKELNLNDDQKAKIKEINDKAQTAAREAFAGMRDLSAEERQAKMAEMREKMQSARKDTNKALEGVLVEHQAKRLKEIFVQARGPQALRNAEVQKDLGLSPDQVKKIDSPLEILTDDQKAAFEKMKGEKFDVRTLRPAGGGRGGNRGGGAPPSA